MLSVRMGTSKSSDKKLHFISSEWLFQICLTFSLRVSLRGINMYFSVRLDEEDKALIHYVKTKAHKGREMGKNSHSFVNQEEATKINIHVPTRTVLGKRGTVG